VDDSGPGGGAASGQRRPASPTAGPDDASLLVLRRLGCKMATGSGKTVVMAMLVAWAFCNRANNPASTHFPTGVLVCCPNLTVKERLQVLRPENPQNYYEAFEVVPQKYRTHLADTLTWESSAAFRLEQCDAVKFYACSDRLGLIIRYEYEGIDHGYSPDFLVRLANDVTVVLEIKGFEDDETKPKHNAAQRWVSAMNNWGRLGRWDFHVCRDPQLLGRQMAHLLKSTGGSSGDKAGTRRTVKKG
jgi:hypothetical protein